MHGSERMSEDNDREEAPRRQQRCKDSKPIDVPPEMSNMTNEECSIRGSHSILIAARLMNGR